MGQIYATLQLINSWELESARRGLADQDEIKRMQVEMLVDTECLLGAIPLEEMDIMIDPRRRELIVNPEHPEYAIYNLRSVFPYKE